MLSARAFDGAAAERENRRLGKQLRDEIYVASETGATPPQNYALLSNFWGDLRV
jgi:hypothetical protein